MTADWCPNRRQKSLTGSFCCHEGRIKRKTSIIDDRIELQLARVLRKETIARAGGREESVSRTTSSSYSMALSQ